MIAVVLFDLDGTLVQTEELKARSYAEAARELDPEVDSAEVIEAFDHLAGQSRKTVSTTLVERFALPVSPDKYVERRLAIYDAMLADSAVIRAQALPDAITLLHRVRAGGLRTGLTTMSGRDHATRILEALGLAAEFDAEVTADDVAHGKPAPDMYLEVCRRLGVPPASGLAIEDSVAGVQAAVAAGVPCIAVPTYLTLEAMHRELPVPAESIIDDPARLGAAFDARLAASR